MKHFKLNKGITLAALIIVSQTTFAMPGPWYISANAGIFQGMFDAQYNDQTDVIAQNIRQPVNQYGYTGGLAVGYSKPVCNQYFLGGELSANLATDNAYFATGASTAAFTDKLSIKGNIDLAFVPGFFVTDTVAAYGKIGASYASISTDLDSPTGFDASYVNSKSTRDVFGGVLGLGLKKYVTKNAVVFTEYNYHDYGTVNFPDFQNFTATYSHSAHVYSQSILIGASYFLDGDTNHAA